MKSEPSQAGFRHVYPAPSESPLSERRARALRKVRYPARSGGFFPRTLLGMFARGCARGRFLPRTHRDVCLAHTVTRAGTDLSGAGTRTHGVGFHGNTIVEILGENPMARKAVFPNSHGVVGFFHIVSHHTSIKISPGNSQVPILSHLQTRLLSRDLTYNSISRLFLSNSPLTQVRVLIKSTVVDH